MKKLIIKFLLFLPFLFLIVFINYTVDPARLFKTKDFERRIADALIAGYNVTNLENTNYDDRILQQFMIFSLTAKKDVGVFGSSRVMSISSEMFPRKTVLNNGVTAASLEDYISLYEIYRERHVIPSIVIIGVDHWIFNKNNFLIKWQRFGAYYSKFISLIPRTSFDLKIRPQDYVSPIWQQLFSLSYFQDSIQFLRASHFNLFSKNDPSGWFTLTNHKWNENETILVDGSRTNRKSTRDRSPVDVSKMVQDEISMNDCPNSYGYVELDQGLKQKFISFIKFMKKDGVRVILFLPPYHPVSYDFYMHSNKYKILKDVEDFLINVAKTCDLTLVGSYNPGSLSIPESSFLDSMHLRYNELTGNKEFNKIFRDVIK